MNQDMTTRKLFTEREQRIRDVIALKTPDRVPLIFYQMFWAARHAGMTCREAMYDYAGFANGQTQAALEFKPDALMPMQPAITVGKVMELIDYKQLQWPGHAGLDEDVSYQYMDREYMTSAEYEEFALNPSGFWMNKYLPRIAGGFEVFSKFPPYPTVYHTRNVAYLAALAQPDVKAGLNRLIEAAEEAQRMLDATKANIAELNSLGFPTPFIGTSHAPFDVVADYMRGSKGAMLDMFRNKDKMLETIDVVARLLPGPMLKVAESMPGDALKIVFIPLHWGLGGFMSPAQFETFYWPSLRAVMMKFIDAGLTPMPFWEGDCTSRLETIADIPEGKCIYQFEATDLVKAREILGGTVCIRGGVPASLLITGTPDDVRAQCKKIIDVVGKDGGLIMEASVGIPDEAKAENVKAMFEFTQEYGRYG